MQLEFHQLDRRWEHLRVQHPGRQRRLLASLAESGQQVPIVVVAGDGQPDRYVVIDGYKRVTALQQLGRDAALRWCLGSSRNAVRLPSGMRVQLHRNPQPTSSINGKRVRGTPIQKRSSALLSSFLFKIEPEIGACRV
jgi:hypothetical protein